MWTEEWGKAVNAAWTLIDDRCGGRNINQEEAICLAKKVIDLAGPVQLLLLEFEARFKAPPSSMEEEKR